MKAPTPSTLADAAVLQVEARPRYWEDAVVGGQKDTNGDLVPFRYGDTWKPTIDLESGLVVDWPVGTTASIHYKVCDDGQYYLADADGVRLYRWRGHYVPDDLLCPKAAGYSDYIILEIDERGFIEGWGADLDADEWKPMRPEERVRRVG